MDQVPGSPISLGTRSIARATLFALLPCVQASLLTGWNVRLAHGQSNPVVLSDHPCDAAPRRTDPDPPLQYDLASHPPVELIELSLGRWAPISPQIDLFTGAYLSVGGFMRLDVVLDGLVNPPGDTTPAAPFFTPFAYGPNPVFGFIELDLDTDVATGGELSAPHYRYLANVVRFGGKPEGPEFADRVALDHFALDGDIETPPFVDRSGEEFHLALLWFPQQVVSKIVGDSDDLFEAGETWNITAPLLHRAHGFEPFSLAPEGSYLPQVTAQYKHDIPTGLTRIALVFPLTNVAAALMLGQVPQADNADDSDQASILEALVDLRDSAEFVRLFGTGSPEEAIILPWENKEPTAYLDPSAWRPTAILGTSYTEPDPLMERFIWTDVLPNPLRGDVDGDGDAGPLDLLQVQQHSPSTVPGYAEGFSVFDLNHDGVVDPVDAALVSRVGDLDADNDLDLRDFAGFQACQPVQAGASGWADCVLADLDADRDVDLRDTKCFILAWEDAPSP